jgi:RNA polymerase sigma-70 factor (ECF subfamily)
VEWAELIGRVAAHGDRDAFRLLFEHFAPRVKGFLMKLGTDADTAEEIAQGTLLAVWRKAAQFDPSSGGAAAWIFTIARNLRIDSLRRADRAVYAEDFAPEAEEPPRPDAILSGAQDAERVRAAMRTLNPDQAQAIEMAFFHDQTHAQISQALGVPLGTIKARIRFGMMKLRAIIERESGGAA